MVETFYKEKSITIMEVYSINREKFFINIKVKIDDGKETSLEGFLAQIVSFIFVVSYDALVGNNRMLRDYASVEDAKISIQPIFKYALTKEEEQQVKCTISFKMC